MPGWTPQQKSAIEARGSNLLVAASAGSGKTAVLVERILTLILNERTDIDRFLIVTFTQAAAAEMRERINLALTEALETKGEDPYLRRQLTLLNHASISTIHSFCNEVIRSYFHLINVDPRYRIADQTEATLLKMEVADDLMETQYAQGDPLFFRLVDMFAPGRDDAAFNQLLLHLYGFIQSQPDSLEWLRQQSEAFKGSSDDSYSSPWVRQVIFLIADRLLVVEELLSAAHGKTFLPGGSVRYRDTLEIDLEQVGTLRSVMAEADLFSFYEQLASMRTPRLKSIEKEADELLGQEIKELRQEAKDVLNQIRSDLLPRHPAQLARELEELHPLMDALYRLVAMFADHYTRRKAEKGLLDFHDLEHYALAVLRFPEAAETYRRRFAHIFVDEYQDSNPVQESLLNQIKRADNLFMVGDVKQSIYRFRLSDPGLFLQKYNSYQPDAGSLDRKIILDRNFRCSQPVIEAVNCLFSHIMSEQLGEVAYDEEVKLVHGSQELPLTEPGVDVLIVERDAAGEGVEDPLEEAGSIEIEARLVAERIKKLLQQKLYDPQLQAYRNVQYRDIAILMRATQNWAGVFREVFKGEGIPCYADVASGYFDAIEVGIFLDLLRLIDNKRQDIPLIGVMRSPIGGFSVDELIKVRTVQGQGTFYEAVEEYMKTNRDELGERLEQMISRLNDWKNEARLLPMDTFIWKLMIDSGFYSYVGAMPGGVQRQANLRILHDRARQFQKTSFKGLFQFLRFMDQVRTSSGDMDMARVLGENDNVVRLMSIHKSKGLEFPVVIVAGIGRQFNVRDTSAPLLLHKELGLGPRYIDFELRASMETVARSVIRQRIRMESLSEEMRILYVACTRPKSKLILVGSVRGLDHAVKRWAKPPTPYQLSRAKSFMDWLGPVLMRHPQGELLRNRLVSGWREDLWYDNCQWSVQITSRFGLGGQMADKAERAAQTEQWWEEPSLIHVSDEQSLIYARLDWTYPHQGDEGIPSKLFVTQIEEELSSHNTTRLAIPIPEVIAQPQFVDPQPRVTALQRGTAMHTVMQHLGKVPVPTRISDLNRLLEELVEREILTPLEAEAVDLEAVQVFINSPLGERIRKSERVYREKPFNLACPVHEVFPDGGKRDETLLIQGVVDLFFEEEDGIVLVDYKTDRVSGYDQAQLVKHYRGQLSWYRRALEKIRRKPVKEMYLYFFDNHETVRLD